MLVYHAPVGRRFDRRRRNGANHRYVANCRIRNTRFGWNVVESAAHVAEPRDFGHQRRRPTEVCTFARCTRGPDDFRADRRGETPSAELATEGRRISAKMTPGRRLPSRVVLQSNLNLLPLTDFKLPTLR